MDGQDGQDWVVGGSLNRGFRGIWGIAGIEWLRVGTKRDAPDLAIGSVGPSDTIYWGG